MQNIFHRIMINDIFHTQHTYIYICDIHIIYVWHLNVYFLYLYLTYSSINLLIVDLLLFIQHAPTDILHTINITLWMDEKYSQKNFDVNHGDTMSTTKTFWRRQRRDVPSKFNVYSEISERKKYICTLCLIYNVQCTYYIILCIGMQILYIIYHIVILCMYSRLYILLLEYSVINLLKIKFLNCSARKFII